MDAPRWVPRLVLDAAHLDQLREHGGLSGIRDEQALEAALARPQHKHNYEPDSDLAALAAAYGYGLARTHPFNDGNKRAAFLAMMIFLGLNGQDLDVAELAVVRTMTALAEGTLSEAELAAWLRAGMVPMVK